jgi:signal transduction histidine kinase
MALRPGRRTVGRPEDVGPLDVALGLAVVVVAELEVWVPALGSGGLSSEHRPVLAVAAAMAGAALIIRRAAPLVTLAVVMTAAQAQIWLTGTESVTGLAAVLVALFTVGVVADRRSALLGVAVAAWWVLLQGEDLADYAFGLLLVGGPWGAGRLVRGRQLLLDELGRRNAQLEVEQGRTAQLAVAEERARIARDLHDVVAHSLTVMVVQAQAAEAHLVSPRGDLGQAVEAVTAVQEVGRSALTEARRLVGALAEDGDAVLSPSPTLDDVEALVETVRATGLAVSLIVTGERRALPPGVDLTGYRVVQEALTNALKHARGAPAVVRVTYGRESVEVRVTDEGIRPAVTPGEDAVGGRGLQGMRHRVESCGGRLTLETQAGGGFAVAAFFPLVQPAVGDDAQRAAR